MSKFPGGIFSKASGQVSGLVFSQARTRQGKLMTARQLVIPTNPQTFKQQNNRYAQTIATRMVTTLGPGIYRNDWDEQAGMNAGYASLLSIIRQNYKASNILDPGYASTWVSIPPQSSLGDLHFPDTFSISSPSSGEVDFSWSTELGSNGSGTDQAVAVLFDGASTNILSDVINVAYSVQALRSDGGIQLSVGTFHSVGITAVCLLYFRSALAEPENLSPATWLELT